LSSKDRIRRSLYDLPRNRAGREAVVRTPRTSTALARWSRPACSRNLSISVSCLKLCIRMTFQKKGPITELQEIRSKLESDCKRLQEDYLRALADFDNYRRRVERDLEVNQRLTLERLVGDLLPVLDNFDRAVLAAAGGRSIESVMTGVELIHRQLREAMCRHGVAEYSCVGQEFDPRNAEAIGFVQSNDHAPNTVVSEACKGYKCMGKVLRPARVIVARPKDSGVDETDTGAVE